MEGSARIMLQPASVVSGSNDQKPIEQAAAICLRAVATDNDLEVLLVASSSTGKWGLPKGHMEQGEASHETALREACEEAGIEGQIAEASCGSFTYRKPTGQREYHVTVHLLTVSAIRDSYPERSSRSRRWVPLAQACKEVGNPNVAQILRQLLHDRRQTSVVA